MNGTLSTAQLADLLMITSRRVQQLTDEGVIPKVSRGKYELIPAVQGYVRFLQERTNGHNASPADYHAEKARLTKAQADLAELELAKARGEVAPIPDIEREWSRKFAVLRSNVMNVAQRVATQLLGETNEQRFKSVLRAELTDALERTAEAEIPDDDADDE